MECHSKSAFDKNATWTPDSGGSATTLCITGWTIQDGGDIIDVTSTCQNGKQGFIAGIQRCNGNITAFLDSDSLPSAAGIRFGRKGTLAIRVGTSSQVFTLHVIVERVNYQSQVPGAVQVNFDYKSDSLNSAGATVESITYPG